MPRDTAFDAGAVTFADAWYGVTAYAFQIYFDFSGYSDMAIGLGLMLGFVFAKNFDSPYLSESITDMWRRWHLSLSNWLRDYLYIPLGGNRGSTSRTYLNLMAVMLLGGLWHGASWNFVVYGAIHATAMCIQRFLRKRHGRDPGEAPPGFLAHAWRFLLTFHFVVLARILFRAQDFASSWDYVQGMLHPGLVMPRFALLPWAALILGFAIHFSPDVWQTKVEEACARAHPLVLAALLGLVGLLCATLGTGEQLSFIYYQF